MYEKDLSIKDKDKRWHKFVDLFKEYYYEHYGERSVFSYANRFDTVYVISKQIGFIKWLVDNDRINFKRLYEEVGKPQIITYDEWYEDDELCEGKQINERDRYEDLIMLLSINNDPISVILKILK